MQYFFRAEFKMLGNVFINLYLEERNRFQFTKLMDWYLLILRRVWQDDFFGIDIFNKYALVAKYSWEHLL